MDRRDMARLEVELMCFVGSARVIARPFRTSTMNISRNGMLMRWDRKTPAPVPGRTLTIDVQLPESSDWGQRVMQCRATVVRVEEESAEHLTVALRVHTMRFMEPVRNVRRDATQSELAKMPVPTKRAM